ncbi:MAG: MaoC family dehydratase N-terminal domain-containing protein [Rhodobacteraceae bacterium]|nr:MaoC family dehydratase N-terminal domain-containing protein [Paracoccaceae bacterium]
MNAPARTSQNDILDPARAVALQTALGLEPNVTFGAPLPPFFHQLYFWSPEPPENLGRDGHPKVGTGLIPDTGLPRRMWGGGRLTFHRPLIAGQQARRVSIVEKVHHKQGRSGALAFVTLRHDFYQNDHLCLSEQQNIVYREDPNPNAPDRDVPLAPTDENDVQAVSFDPTLLFRYSALTMNGHRIHYDQDYARDMEGYGGLVVHGPLLAQLLMLMAEQLAGRLKAFEFRAVSPLIQPEPAYLCRKGADMWVRSGDARLVMTATVSSAGNG